MIVRCRRPTCVPLISHDPRPPHRTPLNNRCQVRPVQRCGRCSGGGRGRSESRGSREGDECVRRHSARGGGGGGRGPGGPAEPTGHAPVAPCGQPSGNAIGGTAHGAHSASCNARPEAYRKGTRRASAGIDTKLEQSECCGLFNTLQKSDIKSQDRNSFRLCSRQHPPPRFAFAFSNRSTRLGWALGWAGLGLAATGAAAA